MAEQFIPNLHTISVMETVDKVVTRQSTTKIFLLGQVLTFQNSKLSSYYVASISTI